MSCKAVATLLVLIAAAATRAWAADYLPIRGQASAGTFVIELPGIPGPYCAYGIEKRLRDLNVVSRTVMDWDAQQLRVWATRAVSTVDVAAAVEASEYPYEYTVR